MGTRNITRVIMDGQTRVCQYCQWDGYPSDMGVRALMFARTADLAELRRRIDRTSILTTPYKFDLNYTGAKTDASFVEMNEYFYDKRHELYSSHSDSDWDAATEETHRAGAERFGSDAWLDYRLASRNTGVDVLSLIMSDDFATKDDVTFHVTFDLLDVPKCGEGEIQGVVTLDLDEETIEIGWDGSLLSLSVEEVRKLDDKRIESLMEDYEEGVLKEEEVTKLGGELTWDPDHETREETVR